MPSERAPLSARQVVRAFSQLAHEHAGQREQANAALAWRRIEVREGARAEHESTRSRWLGWRVFAPAMATAAAAAVVFGFWGSPEGLEYELSGATAQNGLIRTQADAAHLAFSDTSRIDVARETTLSVDIVAKHSALTRLRKGKLHVAVNHDDDTDWRFFAGPYEVRVVGTKFDLGWEPAGERLSIAMAEGRVRVIGPDFDRSLTSGQKLELQTAPEKVAALAPAAESAPKPEAAQPPAAAAQPAKASEAPAKPSQDWAALVANGKFAAVIQAAEAGGIEHSLTATSVADLKALAQAARYTGRAALAVRAFQTLRQRFSTQSSGRQAAFFLGRIYDQQGKNAEALRWLNTYLTEAPADVYAAEALGRKLTLVRHVEGDAAAARVARQYLERFPTGAYARTARALIQ